MSYSEKAEELISEVSSSETKLAAIKKIAATIKRDHELAVELRAIWQTSR